MKLSPRKLSGTIAVPPSKSDGQRAVLAAGLAKGNSIIYGLGNSADEMQMMENIQNLGAKVERKRDEVHIAGLDKFPSKGDFNFGESGLGFRLTAAQCVVHGGQFNISAVGTLNKRPMNFFKEQFDNSGLVVSGEMAPLTFIGYSDKRTFEIDGSGGSQFLSGLLMALPSQDGDSILNIKDLKSTPYVDMTLKTMKYFGVEVAQNGYEQFSIKGNQAFKSCNYTVEADWSSASCWLALAALGQNIELEGLDMSSFQADKAMLLALENAGCTIETKNNKIVVGGTNRHAFQFDANDCPDLFPALAVLAALTPGATKIKGLNRLAIKESDRGVGLKAELKTMGIQVDLNHDIDEMTIHGSDKIKGGSFSSHHDHRIAMFLGALSTMCNEDFVIDGSESVSKSYPGFWLDLDSITK